jgi:copper chaperone
MIQLTLPTMTCNHCVRTVTETVHRIDADAVLTIDLPTHLVQIDSKQASETFRAALAEEGYAAA